MITARAARRHADFVTPTPILRLIKLGFYEVGVVIVGTPPSSFSFPPTDLSATR
jgi:hypothetical protein